MKKTSKPVKIKSILAVVLILFTVMMSLPVTTLAANNGTLNIHKLDSTGVTESEKEAGKVYKEVNGLYHAYLENAAYSAYKIGTFEQTADPVKVTYTPVSGLVDKSGAAITELNASTDPSNIDVAGLNVAAQGTTTASGPLVFGSLNEFSVYLIKETSLPEGVHGATDFIVTIPMFNKDNNTWEFSVDAYPKNTFANASIEKTIVSGADGSGDNIFYANIGDVLNYQVKVAVPSDIDNGLYTQFNIVDTSSQYLQIDTATITVKGTPSAGGADYVLSVANGDFTVDYLSNVLTLSFTDTGIDKLGNSDTLQVNYDTKILEGAMNEKGGLKNDIALNLKTKDKDVDPIKPDPDKPTPVVKIYSYGVKKLGDGGTPLADATFVLAEKNSSGDYTYLIYNSTTGLWTNASSIDNATPFKTETSGTDINSEAILQFRNLSKDNTYYLFETSAPTGYIILPNPVEIIATDASTDKVYDSFILNDTTGNYDYVAGVGFSKTIENLLESKNPGILPSTGGQGTYIFIATGIALIGLAAFFTIYYRKKTNA